MVRSLRAWAASWDSKRFLPGSDRLVLDANFTPVGMATIVGMRLADGSAS